MSAPAPSVSEAPPPEIPVQAADPTPVPPASTWDPERDLLPYHRADELGPDEPLGARGWIPWVLGAVALVALVLVLLRLFQSDPVTDGAADTSSGSSSGSSSAGTGEEAGEGADAAGDTDGASDDEAAATGSAAPAPEGTGPRLDLATTAAVAVPGTAPATTDLDGDLVAYEADQMRDGDPATTWRTAGDASGQTITLTLAEPAVIDRVGLVNGYAKQVAGVDWYPNNRRILAVTWGFDDGTSVQQTLAERPGLQRLKVPPVPTTTVTLRIDEVTPPGSGSLGRDYTAISEVTLLGRRAG